MKKIAKLLFLSLAFFSCSKDDDQATCPNSAVVMDLSGIAGCGYVFKLSNGTILQPVLNPLPQPLKDFQLYDGRSVTIGYESADSTTIACGDAQLIIITCIQEAGYRGY